MRFLFLPLDRKKYDQMQGEGYNLELGKFKGCKYYHLEGHYFERRRPVHVHNPKKIKRKQSGVVPEPKWFLRRSGLWTYSTAYLTVMIYFIYLWDVAQ